MVEDWVNGRGFGLWRRIGFVVEDWVCGRGLG